MTDHPAAGVGLGVLATDLDGTLIPLEGNVQNRADLQVLATQLELNAVQLVYVTGRHLASVVEAIDGFQLPTAGWLIADVGTSIYKRQVTGEFQPVEAYQRHQEQLIASMPIDVLRQRLEPIEGLSLQEPEKQGPFKLSFYTDAADLDGQVERVRWQLDQTHAPYSIIHSVDPFSGDGLIDLLPAGVSKAHALAWWVQNSHLRDQGIVFAGDSGNDLAALTAGYRSIVVGNADRSLAKQVYQAHRDSGWENRLYLARAQATSGVLEGCRWFGLAEPPEPTEERLGATPLSHNETRFCVWAPRRRTVAVRITEGATGRLHGLRRQDSGYFTGNVSEAGPNSRYEYVLDDRDVRPDPASRYQPDGVHGPSQVVDPRAFPWTDQNWKGVAKRDLIIYELHVGAFTLGGTFQSAIERLEELLELGVTAIEIMPVAQSPGRWNWGYDGVDLFAVRNTYGEPDDFKAFVDACHAMGIAVLLDVVYNHIGPEGNYLGEFGPYFSSRHRTPWGEALNFDGPQSEPVRRFVIENAIFWLEEFHLDGLRLDAVHFIQDNSEPTILDELRLAVLETAQSTGRTLHLIAETNVCDQELLTAQPGRPAYDAVWCDCLMHSIYSHALPDLRLTNREYRGASDLAGALRHGYVYVGRQSTQGSAPQRRDQLPVESGEPNAESFVMGLQTHDSVGNHPHGKRIHQLTSKAFQKAAAGMTLLYPSIPLLFMGEEFAADSPFPFFTDFHDVRLQQAIDQGRAREYPQHVWGNVLSPSEAQTFYSAKCHDNGSRDREMLSWYRELISLRKQGIAEGWLNTARMQSEHDADLNIFYLRFTCDGGGLIVVQARLTSTAQTTAQPVRRPVGETLLLSSEPNPRTDDGHIDLQCNHVVISRSRPASH